MQRKVYSVSAVNRYVKQLFQQDVILSGLWIGGEISNFKRHSSGHLYFTLKDESGSMAAVMFSGDARSLLFRPQDGQQVQVQGYVSLYEKTGQYQLYVKKMEQTGSGALYLAFEALKEKLQKQGLFDPDRKREIPAYPRQIGIVTSPTGAAVRDMIQIARRRHPGVQLVLYPALVQGAEAASTIVRGIRCLDQMAEVDTIIVGRGGGSIEDLWPFNEEQVALAIAEAKTPVISAVGHETDFTIADFVADLRAPTPSAAAELAVPDVQGLWGWLEDQRQARRRSAQRLLRLRRQRLELLWQKVKAGSPVRKLDEYRQQMDIMDRSRRQQIRQCLTRKQYQLEGLGQRLALLSPSHPLSRGYALITDLSGNPVVRAGQTVIGQTLTVMMQDGQLDVTVDQIRETPQDRLGNQ